MYICKYIIYILVGIGYSIELLLVVQQSTIRHTQAYAFFLGPYIHFFKVRKLQKKVVKRYRVVELTRYLIQIFFEGLSGLQSLWNHFYCTLVLFTRVLEFRTMIESGETSISESLSMVLMYLHDNMVTQNMLRTYERKKNFFYLWYNRIP